MPSGASSVAYAPYRRAGTVGSASPADVSSTSSGPNLSAREMLASRRSGLKPSTSRAIATVPGSRSSTAPAVATIGPYGNLLAASTIAYASAAAKPGRMNERWRCGAKSDDAAVSSERVISGCSSQTAITSAAGRSRRASITTPARATTAGTNQNSATVVPNHVSPSARQRLLENGSITLPPWPTSYLSCSGLYT